MWGVEADWPLQAFNVPKSDVEIVRGGKSRDKTVSISGLQVDLGDGDGEEKALNRMKEALERAALGNDGRKSWWIHHDICNQKY